MKTLKNYLYKTLLFIFLFSTLLTNSNSESSFYKCTERVTDVRIGDNLYKKDNIIGNNFIKLDKSNNKTLISIFLQFTNLNKKPIEIIKNKETKKTTLGFDFLNNHESSKSTKENYYNFIKISNSYVFTKKEFFWAAKDDYNDEVKRDYDSGGRCTKINLSEYNNFLKIIEQDSTNKNITKKTKNKSYDWMAVSSHPESNNNFVATKLSTKEKAINLAMNKCYEFVSNNLGKKGYQKCSLVESINTKDKKNKVENKKSLVGKRTFALFWSGYDELIIGNLFFIEKDLIGRVEFDLPNNEGSCYGTYVLPNYVVTPLKGTWTFLCENNKNASGILKWDISNGNISGEGIDMLGNKVKIKISDK